jgi:ATP-binding cassette subfamily F protein uup
VYASVEQWLSAYQRATAEVARPAKPATRAAAPRAAPAEARPRKLSYREQQELAQMEATILAAEQTLAERQAEVERAASAGHVALADACRALEAAQQAVEGLYARWQELEARNLP